MASDSAPLLPITVLTGFLGSGKTTLLNHLLRHPATGRVAVIVNEFGEVGLDNLLVEPASEDTVLLGSGCICCAVRSDLVDTLVDLHERRRAGSLPAFDRVVVETTGLAEPAPILQTLMSDPAAVSRYYLDGIVTTVDAIHAEAALSEYGESAKQVALADRLVITKVDLASPSAIAALESRVRAINPGARLLRAAQGDLEPKSLLDIGLYDAKSGRPDVHRWLRAEAYHGSPGILTAGSRHTAGIQAFCLYREEPLSRALLGMWLAEIAGDFGAQLLRVKGIVNLAGSAGPMVIQGVQHRFYPPVSLKAWPTADRRTRIVCIARNLDQSVIEASLEAGLERWPVPPGHAAAR